MCVCVGVCVHVCVCVCRLGEGGGQQCTTQHDLLSAYRPVPADFAPETVLSTAAVGTVFWDPVQRFQSLALPLQILAHVY